MPLIKNNLICVRGRINKAYIPDSSKNQIIIPNNHYLATLISLYIHEINCHSGRDLTLNLIRETFWIINGKSIVRKVINSCSYCKRLRINPKPP